MAFNVFSGEWVEDLSHIALPPVRMAPGSVVAPLMTPSGSGVLCAKYNSSNPSVPSAWKMPAMGEHPCPYTDGTELSRVAYGGCSVDLLGKSGMDATSKDGFISALGSVRLLNTWAKRANITLEYTGLGESPGYVLAQAGVYVRRHYRGGIFDGKWAWENIALAQLDTSEGLITASLGLWYRCVLWFFIEAQGDSVDGQYVDGSVSLSVSYSG